MQVCKKMLLKLNHIRKYINKFVSNEYFFKDYI